MNTRESRCQTWINVGRRILGITLLSSLLFLGSGCYLMKVVSVPMRVVGAAASILPVVGNTFHDTIDGAADAVEGG